MTTHPEPGILAQFAEGTLPTAAADVVRAHLAECRSCMAAYSDAVRYRAAWLADSEAFALEAGMRSVALNPGAAAVRAGTHRPPHLILGVSVATAAGALAIWASVSTLPERAPSLGFPLPPAVRQASELSSARGLVLPGAERLADRLPPERRSGQPSSWPELDGEVRSIVNTYNDSGPRGPEAGTTVVAALLANGEIESATEYAREALRKYPKDVRLLVFAADARYRSGDPSGAETLLRQARRHAPRDPLVALDLALVARQSGHHEEARALLTQVARSRVAPLAARASRELAAGP
jgi:tetratricopeptide (TPR) repeat protein